MKKKKLIVLTILYCLISVFTYIPVFAISSDAKVTVKPDEFSEWDNGVEVIKEIINNTNGYTLKVNADTIGLADGYYSYFLYENKSRNLGGYDGVSFEINNKNEIPLKMNVSMTPKSGTGLTLKDEGILILESLNGNEGEVIQVSNGIFEIPAGFNGVVYIPFNQLKNDDGKEVSINNIATWGFTGVLEEEQEVKYEISNINFLKGSFPLQEEKYKNIHIAGNDKIYLSSKGTIIENFKAEVKTLEGEAVNSDVTFFLENAVEGASISEDGRLEIASDCKETAITVCAKSSDSFGIGKFNVQLLKPESENKTSYIPASSEIKSIMPPAYQFLIDKIVLARIVLIVIALIFLGIFGSWLVKLRIKYLILKKEIYQLEENPVKVEDK